MPMQAKEKRLLESKVTDKEQEIGQLQKLLAAAEHRLVEATTYAFLAPSPFSHRTASLIMHVGCGTCRA
jgi:hypothetical protein